MTTNTDLHGAMPELHRMTNEQAKAAALSWHGEAGGELLPQLTANELAGIVNEAIQQAAVPETEDLRELLAKAPRLHAMLTMGGCPSCGSKDCIALSCQLEPPKQQPDSQYSGYWPDTPPRPVQQPALGRGEGGGVPQWLPIETAPKDGTRVMLTVKGYTGPKGMFCYPDNDNDILHLARYNSSFWEPYIPNEWTHWMPLPPAPTGQINPDSAGQGMEGVE